MPNLSFAEVLNKCAEGRFFSYDNWRDRIFVPPSVLLVWIFLRLGWSGSAVSFLSGAVGLVGGVLLASSDPAIVVIGSFGYMLFYFLDYVDGSVARMQGRAAIGGQYIDWTMHVVCSVGVAVGLFAGALNVAGSWIIPFGVFTAVAAALTLGRYSFAWFAICMHYQQQRAKGRVKRPPNTSLRLKVHSPFYRLLRKLPTILFNENYVIFVLPLLAVCHLFLAPLVLDFRVVLIIIGGAVYFPVVIYDIWFLANEGYVENSYKKLFFDDSAPRLPEDHFLQ